MAARKDDSPAISLFSFQDIITSLTGIMFLIVLLLVLFMIDMRPKTEEEEAPPEQQEEVTESMAKSVESLRAQLRAYQKRSETLRERIDQLRKMDLEHIQEKISQLRLESEQLLSRKELLIRENETLSETIREVHISVAQTQNEQKPIPEELAKLAQKIEQAEKDLQSRHAKTRQIKNAVKYTIENTSTRKPVLVECSRDGIRILDCSTGAATDLRNEGDSYIMQKVRFLRWLKERDRSDEYYTILIKPGSFDYADLVDALKKNGKERGLELLPDDDLTVFGGI